MLASGLLLQGAVLSLFPEEVIVTTLGVLWSQDKIGFIEAVVAVQLGLLPANLCWAFLGSRVGRRIFAIRPFCWMLKPSAIDSALCKLNRHGAWVVFFTRFVPLVRGPVYFATGLAQLPLKRFFLTDFAASCIQIPLMLLMGGYIGASSGSILEAYQRIGYLMAGLVVLAALCALMKRRHEQNTYSSATRAP